MGRREEPLEGDGSALTVFAVELRAVRSRSGKTYAQLAAEVNYSVSTLQEACAGKRLPTLPVTLAVVGACGGDAEAWEQRRRELRASQLEVANIGEDTSTTLVASPHRVAWLRRRAVLGAVGLVTVAGASLLWWAAGRGGGQSAAADGAGHYREQEYHRGGAPSLMDPRNVAGVGPDIAFKAFVLVDCKLLAPSIPSASPDGYWYRVSTSPWNGHYYIAANTFLNGDPENGPYTHNTDIAVSDC